MSDKQQVKGFSFFTARVITTISIALVLFLLGILCLVGLIGRGFSSYLKENMAISIEVSDEADEVTIEKLEDVLEKNQYVRSAVYVSKEEIKQQLIRDLGRDPEEVLGYDPSHSFYDVYIKSQYVNRDSIKKVEASLKGINLVKNIVYDENDINMANTNLSKIGSVLLIFAVMLLVISYALIHNTIQLDIYAKRFLINTMRLVGATNGFIRRPFVWQMIFCGIFAALLANLMITGVAYYFMQDYPELTGILHTRELIAVYVVVLALGIIITAFATTLAVNRYLRMKTNKLYHI